MQSSKLSGPNPMLNAQTGGTYFNTLFKFFFSSPILDMEVGKSTAVVSASILRFIFWPTFCHSDRIKKRPCCLKYLKVKIDIFMFSLLRLPPTSSWPRVGAWCDPKSTSPCCSDIWDGRCVSLKTSSCTCER